MKQLGHELAPKTSLAKATMAKWKAEVSRARRAELKASREAGVTEIPLEQLDENLDELRHVMG